MPNFTSNGATATVFAENDGSGPGLYGFSKGVGTGITFGYGIIGVLTANPNIFPINLNGAGMIGVSSVREGVIGVSSAADGVLGISSSNLAAGVTGQRGPDGVNATTGVGVRGIGGALGVDGQGHEVGVKGTATIGSNAVGVWGESAASNGVLGLAHNPNAGVSALNDAGGIGLYAESSGGAGLAGQFRGNVLMENDLEVRGNITHCNVLTVTGDVLLTNRDVAERFEVEAAADCEPGMVMVMGENGGITPCEKAYDKRAIGVVSGAGSFRPALTLGCDASTTSAAVALVGTAYCMADATENPIETGDLLTCSDTRGHAMKAADPGRGLGAIIGKALAPLHEGRGLVPMVVTLQ